MIELTLIGLKFNKAQKIDVQNMQFACYFVDGDKIVVPYLNTDIVVGDNIVVSNEFTDLSFRQDWYPQGYAIYDIFNRNDFNTLYSSIESAVASVIEKQTNIKLENFKLVNYHKFVTKESEHLKVVSKTRDLFCKDFDFPILNLIEPLGRLVDTNLTDFNRESNERIHIIVRINRPGSIDFNPPHKDIYGILDRNSSARLTYMNFWLPICGVTQQSTLPIVPASHLIPESHIRRSRSGAYFGGNKYRVNMVLNWQRSNELKRTPVRDGQVLCFSSHLIHGLAVNQEPDKTRVSLEFRLVEDI